MGTLYHKYIALMIERNPQSELTTTKKNSRKKELKKVLGAWTIAEIQISYKPLTTNISRVTGVEDVHQLIRQLWDLEKICLQEQFVAYFFNVSNKIIGHKIISTGSMKQCVVDVRLLVSLALHCLADHVIIAHNHPSGNLKPSAFDETITLRVKEALNLIDVRLLDHLIITENEYLSFACEGLL